MSVCPRAVVCQAAARLARGSQQELQSESGARAEAPVAAAAVGELHGHRSDCPSRRGHVCRYRLASAHLALGPCVHGLRSDRAPMGCTVRQACITGSVDDHGLHVLLLPLPQQVSLRGVTAAVEQGMVRAGLAVDGQV